MPILKPKLYRDDDPNVYTDAFKFKEVHEYFLHKGKQHIAAIIMKDIWENHALFYYLATAPLLQIGLHGWEHKDYSKLSYEECYDDLKKSLSYWKTNSKRMTGGCKEIKIFFAPWNHESENIKRACADLGLKFCNKREGYWDEYYIKSFHWWACIDGPIL
jgi:hypothetical protein